MWPPVQVGERHRRYRGSALTALRLAKSTSLSRRVRQLLTGKQNLWLITPQILPPDQLADLVLAQLGLTLQAIDTAPFGHPRRAGSRYGALCKYGKWHSRDYTLSMTDRQGIGV